MRFPTLAMAAWLSVWLAVWLAATPPASAQAASSSASLTLAEAMRLAETTHPSVRAREAQLAAAEGSRREASALLFNNPELSTERTRRRIEAPDGRRNEWSVGMAQPFETGGQQARRREAAAAGLDALRAEIEAVRRQARADAATRSLTCSPLSVECCWNNARWTCSTAARRRSPSGARQVRTRVWTPTSPWSKPNAHAVRWPLPARN